MALLRGLDADAGGEALGVKAFSFSRAEDRVPGVAGMLSDSTAVECQQGEQ